MPDQQNVDELAAMRVEYAASQADGAGDLDETWVADGWAPLLRRWIDEARAAGAVDPNAMVLATVREVDGTPRPVARTVLCKGLSPEGIDFYTNYESAKGRQLAAVPFAAATFLWQPVSRQVHLRGPVERVASEVTEAYWRSRPRDSRLGAWASAQSEPIASRAALDARLAEVTARFAGTDDVPLPPFWGGFRLRPEEVEFWQGRRGRLHNRIVVRLGAEPQVGRVQP
ncbi:pyridoxamine 5'-phosphate oxidase [Nocardia asteroides]|uniref:pyridoxamine 5'-phosphate oxidase n=1 Tax=Nocardia asteroides TaxID=1824 RepID=UPI001E3ABB92|nr:pyridoxamine 5'-phosphate oxidase [Nocardia asteroides]UGT59820.1 pyridoxamine 5'-phosphate oxidase [Nocardia asteroides]